MADTRALVAPAGAPAREFSQLYWFWRKCYMFVRRDLLFETSYKLQSLFRMLSIFFTVLTFYFLAQLIGGDISRTHLDRYGGHYFTYVVVGISFMGFFNAGIVSFTTSIRQQLTVGALEAMAAAPIRSVSLLFYSIIWPLGWELCKALLYVVMARLVFGAQIALARLPLLLVTLALCVLVFGSLGIIAASLIIYFKRGDPIAWFLSSFSSLLGGVLFPISVLPTWLRWISELVPVKHALDALRASLIPAAQLDGVEHSLVALGIFAVVLAPAAWLCAHIVFEKARMHGNLSQY